MMRQTFLPDSSFITLNSSFTYSSLFFRSSQDFDLFQGFVDLIRGLVEVD